MNAPVVAGKLCESLIIAKAKNTARRIKVCVAPFRVPPYSDESDETYADLMSDHLA